MPPEACSGVGAMRAGDRLDELGPRPAGARAVEVDEVHPSRACSDPACRERRRLVGALDHVFVGALVQPDGLRAEDVDCRDHLDPLFEPHVRMLAC